jgi:UDP-N-acetylglucosamine 1-carboxyvinyltransferase
VSEPASNHVLYVEGGRPLHGRIGISGSKNASLAIMAGSILTEEPVLLRNVPGIADTALMREILEALGSTAEEAGSGGLKLQAKSISSTVPASLARRMRASIVLLGALLARTGEAKLPRPGGDEIGARRVEQHVRGLREMGAKIIEGPDDFLAQTPGRLRGARIVLDLPTVTGTENLVMAATLADGRTEIFNAAREPHVQDLCRFLQSMGAQIYGAGTDVIVVEGVDRLSGTEHRVIPDYLEAGTFAIAVAATGGDVVLEEAPHADLTQVLLKLEHAGAQVEVLADAIRVSREPDRALEAVDMVTWVHPGFPTDLQAQYMALMTQARGETVIWEPLFENRFQQVPELTRMGAQIEVRGRDVLVSGPAALHANAVTVPDIRSGAALVIAALVAHGETELRGAWHIDRGYQDLGGKLGQLGAAVVRSGVDGTRSEPRPPLGTRE